MTTRPASSAQKSCEGMVVSRRMAKTIVVRLSRKTRHAVYGRVLTTVSSVKAHDEHSHAKVGDWVKIVETRPLSKEKRWRLVEILTPASTTPSPAELTSLDAPVRSERTRAPAAASPSLQEAAGQQAGG